MISDSRQLSMLRRFYRRMPHPRTNNVMKCSTSALYQLGGVFIASNGEDSKIVGTATCKSSWACPHCTAIIMSQHGRRIAAAIEALKKEDIVPVMMTLTVAHTKFMTAEQVFSILKKTWAQFTDTRRDHRFGIDTPWTRFRQETGAQHFARVFEFTWGQNGFNPHIHMLIFVPRNKLSCLTKEIEEEMNARWIRLAKKRTMEICNDQLKHIYKKNEKSLHISRNADGTPHIMTSGAYLTSSEWTAEAEMTNHHAKTARRKGQYTMWQVLKNAEENPKKQDKWLGIFREYAIATWRTKRVFFSKGLSAIADAWLEKHPQCAEFQKKNTNDQPPKKFQAVCWFDADTWYYLCFHNDTANPIIETILNLAKEQDPFNKIKEYLRPMKYRPRRPNEFKRKSIAEDILKLKIA